METQNLQTPLEMEHPESAVVEEEEEVEDLKQELVALIADKQYHEFIDDVVKNKDVVDDVHDKDYDPSEEGVEPSSGRGSGAGSSDDGVVGEGTENEVDEKGDGSSSPDSSDTEDDAGIDDAEEDGDAVGEDVEVRIPKDMLAEAERRFPPFWRTKQALGKLNSGSYKSEDDLDYVPEEDGDASDENPNPGEPLGVEGSGEADDYREADGAETESEESAEEDEVEMRGEVEGLKKDQEGPVQPDVNSLAEMVEMMTLPPGDGIEPVEVDDSETESMDDEEGGDGPSENVQENILSFDHDDYRSDEDPDYVPEDQGEEDVDSSASSEDESSDDLDRME